MPRSWGLGHALEGWDVSIDEMIWGLVSPVRVTSEGGLVGELSVAQGALVDVWEVCLSVEGSQDGVVGPERTIDAEVSAWELWVLGHILN
jgi:hypothetical protein